VAFLLLAQRADLGVVGRALGAAVPGIVVIGTVAVFLAVGLVVLLVIADQVLQGEAVVAGDEVDAGVRLAAVILVQVAAAGEARGQLGRGPSVSLPEAAHAVSVLAVPFGPEHGKVAYLVAARPDIPRLGDQLHLREQRV